MSLKWIAQRLAMGTEAYVSNLLRDRADISPAKQVSPLCQW
jgi:hypothetical protein